MNKKLLCPCFVVLCLCLLTLAASGVCFPSAKEIGNTMEAAIPTDFGYIDNTDYYLAHELSALSDVDDAYIVTCADSTNFNEFGIFVMKDRSDIKTAKKILQNYLDRRTSEFKNGVIYNIDEYPKFQNASVFSFDRYLCYTILKPADIKKATAAVKSKVIQ